MKEALGWRHSKATTAIAVVGTLGAVCTLWYTAGGAFWSTVDFWVGTFLIFVLAALQIILFSWVFGIERGWKEMHSGASIAIPSFYKVVMKYIAPAYLIIVFIGFCVQNLGASIASAWSTTGSRVAIIVIAVTLLLLLAVVLAGERRWRAAGVDLDDASPVTE
jgi:hypothetical protein